MAGGRFRLRNYEFSSRMRRVTLPGDWQTGDWQTGDWQIGGGPSSLKGAMNAAMCSHSHLAHRFADGDVPWAGSWTDSPRLRIFGALEQRQLPARRQMSVLCVTETPAPISWVVNTTFLQMILRWCCTDPVESTLVCWPAPSLHFLCPSSFDMSRDSPTTSGRRITVWREGLGCDIWSGPSFWAATP